MKQQPELPAKISPDVLAPSEDPSKYGSVQKQKPVAIPVVRATVSPTAISSHVSTATPAIAASPAMFSVYRTPARASRKNVLVLVGAAAAVVVLGLAITLYPSHKSSVPATTTGAAAQEAPAAAPVPSSLVAVPLPKSAGEQSQAAAPSRPAASPGSVVKHEQAKPAAEPKAVTEPAPQQPAPVLHVVSGRPAAKASEEAVEPPALSLMAASSASMPALPGGSHAAPSLAARKSTLVAATLVQGRAPQYPQAAKRLGLSGTVKLQLSISAEGKVTDVRVLSGDPLFRQPSIAAVRDWVYRPAHLDGRPVASTGEVSLQFNPGK